MQFGMDREDGGREQSVLSSRSLGALSSMNETSPQGSLSSVSHATTQKLLIEEEIPTPSPCAEIASIHYSGSRQRRKIGSQERQEATDELLSAATCGTVGDLALLVIAVMQESSYAATSKSNSGGGGASSGTTYPNAFGGGANDASSPSSTSAYASARYRCLLLLYWQCRPATPLLISPFSMTKEDREDEWMWESAHVAIDYLPFQISSLTPSLVQSNGRDTETGGDGDQGEVTDGRIILVSGSDSLIHIYAPHTTAAGRISYIEVTKKET